MLVCEAHPAWAGDRTIVDEARSESFIPWRREAHIGRIFAHLSDRIEISVLAGAAKKLLACVPLSAFEGGFFELIGLDHYMNAYFASRQKLMKYRLV
jgi:hypothetical protein